MPTVSSSLGDAVQGGCNGNDDGLLQMNPLFQLSTNEAGIHLSAKINESVGAVVRVYAGGQWELEDISGAPLDPHCESGIRDEPRVGRDAGRVCLVVRTRGK